MTDGQEILIYLGVLNLLLGFLNRLANRANYRKLKEILTEEKKQSEKRNDKKDTKN